MSAMPPTVASWHAVVASRDVAELSALIADGAVFRSPALHTPQAGKELTLKYLTAALDVLGPTIAYQREWYADSSAVLEFKADLEGVIVHGVDMFEWDVAGQISDFQVMVRPFKGLVKLMELMVGRLEQG
ncbi:nuclear transport factor 2 family protein [Nocardioides montaniterrae]